MEVSGETLMYKCGSGGDGLRINISRTIFIYRLPFIFGGYIGAVEV